MASYAITSHLTFSDSERMDGQQVLGLSCLCLPSPGIAGTCHWAQLLHRCWMSNPGPHTWAESTILTEPSPQLPDRFLK